MRHQIEPAIVRITNRAGTPIGAGLLAGEGKILTCAHVVREALDLPENPQEPPDDAIHLDFPLIDGDTALSGRVFLWRPELDIAGLAVDGPMPEAARPLSLVAATDFWGHSFRAYGFPKGREDGVWAKGEIRGPQAQGWLQIDTGPGGYHVEPGFSGGPVWDEMLGGVVGLVTRSDTKAGVRAAYIIPVSLLIEARPELAGRSRPPSPYRGLKAFREVDAANFYGRDTYTNRLVQEVDQNGLLAVIGPSGSGKSSVVFAGLLPALRRNGSWLILDFRPGRDPFRSLAAALLPFLEPGMSEVDRLIETSKLAAALEAGDLELAGILTRLLALDGAAERVLLIADQFEELYTLNDDPECRRRFLDVLLALEASGPPAAPCTLCLTLRADFMGQALSYRPFADRLQDHDIKLGPMNREELRAAIVEPAAALDVDLEPGLVNRILDDVGQEPGNLPLLEFALTLLWEEQQLGRLTHEAYNSIGQVQGALARHAETVFARLTPEEQAVARSVFVQLIQPGAGTADTRRLATREEVGDGNWTLVQQLAGERLLTTGGDEQGRETVEVAHEALIQHWGRLQGWMAEDRSFREWQQRLRAAMAMWQASGQDDGALLRGAPLAEAEAWATELGEYLPPGERAYISACVAARETQARKEEERRQYNLAIVRAQTVKDARVAQELHDTIQQVLGRLPFYLAVSRDLYKTNPERVAELLSRSIDEVEDAARSLRQIRHELAPSTSMLEDGLIAPLTTLVTVFRNRTGLTTSFNTDPDVDAMTTLEVRHTLYRVIQQALDNVEIHAQASNVAIRVYCDSGWVVFSVEDDGRGSTPEERATAQAAGSWGLQSMRARLDSCGGQLMFNSQLGLGTKVGGQVPATRSNANVT